MVRERRSLHGDDAVPAALGGEGQALGCPLQGVGVRQIGRLLAEQVAIDVPSHPGVIELQVGASLHACMHHAPACWLRCRHGCACSGRMLAQQDAADRSLPTEPANCARMGKETCSTAACD